MNIFRIIIVIILLLGVFVLPWWLMAFLFALGVFTFPFFYEGFLIALLADLFYDHSFFAHAGSHGYFIPVFAICVSILIFIFERFRGFVL